MLAGQGLAIGFAWELSFVLHDSAKRAIAIGLLSTSTNIPAECSFYSAIDGFSYMQNN